MNSPDDFSLDARRIVAVLQPYTPFAEAIVRRQAERAGLDPKTLVRIDFTKVVPMIVVATAMFVDPAALIQIKQALAEL